MLFMTSSNARILIGVPSVLLYRKRFTSIINSAWKKNRHSVLMIQLNIVEETKLKVYPRILIIPKLDMLWASRYYSLGLLQLKVFYP